MKGNKGNDDKDEDEDSDEDERVDLDTLANPDKLEILSHHVKLDDDDLFLQHVEVYLLAVEVSATALARLCLYKMGDEIPTKMTKDYLKNRLPDLLEYVLSLEFKPVQKVHRWRLWDVLIRPIVKAVEAGFDTDATDRYSVVANGDHRFIERVMRVAARRDGADLLCEFVW